MKRRRFLQAAAVTSAAVAARATGAAPDHLDAVRGVITAWRRKDLEGMLAHIDDEIVWHSHVGSPPILGKAAMREFATSLTAQMDDIRWRIFEVAQNGDRVHLEGVDDYVTKDGRRVVLPYAGVLGFRGPLIVEWRDYFDRGLFERLKAGEPPPPYLESLTNRPALF
jgi:ketosteroid isomerase-like protein